MVDTPEEVKNKPQYFPQIFDQPNIERAASIILTPEAGISTEQRWERETPYLADLLGKGLFSKGWAFSKEQPPLILDYGCGVGRLAVDLVDRGAVVVGVDISASMRAQALQYAEGRPRFTVISPEMLPVLVAGGLRFDAAFSVWALQHVLDIKAVVACIKAALGSGGRIALVNSRRRLVPVVEAGEGAPPGSVNQTWADDGFNLSAYMSQEFTPVLGRNLNPAKVGDAVAGSSFYGVWKKDGRDENNM